MQSAVAHSPMPKVSVILPVYNGAGTLASAMQSILEQTFADFELLVIDDGSEDESIRLAARYADDRIRIVGVPGRRGLAQRLNEGIDEARGSYIARMDADDISFPERFQHQVGFLDAHHDVDLVGCRAVVFRGNRIVGLLPFAATHDAICARPWRGFPLAHPSWMGRTEWFRRYRYASPEVKRAEDQDLLLRSHEQSRFACLDQVLLAYRQTRFSLAKTLSARRSLLKAQLSYFAGRAQWGRMATAAALTAVRVTVDVAAALPGFEELFFARMRGDVPAPVVRQLERWGVGKSHSET